MECLNHPALPPAVQIYGIENLRILYGEILRFDLCDMTTVATYATGCGILRWQFQLRVNMLAGSWGRATRPLRTAMDSSHTGLVHRFFRWREHDRKKHMLPDNCEVADWKWIKDFFVFHIIQYIQCCFLEWLSLVYGGQAALQDIARKTELHHARWGFSGSRSTWLCVSYDATGTS